MKRFIVVLLGVMMAASLIVGCATGGRGRQTGTFRGSAVGFGGPVVVDVTFDRGNIQSIEVVSHNETYMFFERPFERVISSVLNDNNLNVDVVTGATLSSMAIRAAITEALTAANVNVGAIMRPRVAHAPQNIQMTADVVVIGGGGAGLAAAARASQLGASVIVVETLSMLGGSTLLSGNNMNVTGTPQLAALGIQDSPDLHFQQTLAAGDGVGRAPLVRVMADNSLVTMNWLGDLGVRWTSRINPPRGHSAYPARFGQGWITALRDYANRPNSNVEILLETRATELITQGGRVTGARATGRFGNEYTFTARNGVILATGGFSANAEMLMRYDELWGGRLDASLLNSNFPSSQGDGIRIAQAIGANLIDMGYIQFLPGCPINTLIVSLAGGASFMVNEQGRRFVAENARRDVVIQAMFEQTNYRMFQIADSRAIDRTVADVWVENGFIHRADTIAELAELIGINPTVLKGTIEEFDALLAAGVPCQFGRNFGTARAGSIDPTAGPFYATPRIPIIHHTMGGVEIDTYTRVLNVNGNVISGLYAGGEVVGGVHGTNRLAGNAITEAFVFGRIAGESAAQRR